MSSTNTGNSKQCLNILEQIALLLSKFNMPQPEHVICIISSELLQTYIEERRKAGKLTALQHGKVAINMPREKKKKMPKTY